MGSDGGWVEGVLCRMILCAALPWLISVCRCQCSFFVSCDCCRHVPGGPDRSPPPRRAHGSWPAGVAVLIQEHVIIELTTSCSVSHWETGAFVLWNHSFFAIQNAIPFSTAFHCGDKALKFQVVCPQNGTAVLKTLSASRYTVASLLP